MVAVPAPTLDLVGGAPRDAEGRAARMTTSTKPTEGDAAAAGFTMPTTSKPAPPVGVVRWNTYFNDWLLVVRYDDDAHWWFVLPNRDRLHIFRARARYSELSEPADPTAVAGR
jgi:hypothetical protein